MNQVQDTTRDPSIELWLQAISLILNVTSAWVAYKLLGIVKDEMVMKLLGNVDVKAAMSLYIQIATFYASSLTTTFAAALSLLAQQRHWRRHLSIVTMFFSMACFVAFLIYASNNQIPLEAYKTGADHIWPPFSSPLTKLRYVIAFLSFVPVALDSFGWIKGWFAARSRTQ